MTKARRKLGSKLFHQRLKQFFFSTKHNFFHIYDSIGAKVILEIWNLFSFFYIEIYYFTILKELYFFTLPSNQMKKLNFAVIIFFFFRLVIVTSFSPICRDVYNLTKHNQSNYDVRLLTLQYLFLFGSQKFSEKGFLWFFVVSIYLNI